MNSKYLLAILASMGALILNSVWLPLGISDAAKPDFIICLIVYSVIFLDTDRLLAVCAVCGFLCDISSSRHYFTACYLGYAGVARLTSGIFYSPRSGASIAAQLMLSCALLLMLQALSFYPFDFFSMDFRAFGVKALANAILISAACIARFAAGRKFPAYRI